jgi:hypothetical protein
VRWAHAEGLRASTQHPLGGLLTQVIGWLVPVAAAAYAATRQRIVGGDTELFVTAGRTLLSGHWDRAFAASTVQVGPVQLALYGSVGRWPETLALALAIGTALLVVAAARAASVKSGLLLCGVGLLAVETGLTGVGYSVGHPADAVLPLLWIIAADQARRGHTWCAGLLVGLSAGLETWGILGVAVLALAARKREMAKGIAVAGAAALVLFLPFMLGGHFSMLSFQWRVRPPSPLSLLVADGTVYGWSLRLAQGALAVTAGVAVAWFLRRSPHAPWAAPLAVVVMRLQLDPLLFQYYLTGPQGPVLVGAAVGASRLGVLQRVRERCPKEVFELVSALTGASAMRRQSR